MTASDALGLTLEQLHENLVIRSNHHESDIWKDLDTAFSDISMTTIISLGDITERIDVQTAWVCARFLPRQERYRVLAEALFCGVKRAVSRSDHNTNRDISNCLKLYELFLKGRIISEPTLRLIQTTYLFQEDYVLFLIGSLAHFIRKNDNRSLKSTVSYLRKAVPNYYPVREEWIHQTQDIIRLFPPRL